MVWARLFTTVRRTDLEDDRSGLEKQEVAIRAACLEGNPASRERPWRKEWGARGTLQEFLFSYGSTTQRVGAAPCFRLACDHPTQGVSSVPRGDNLVLPPVPRLRRLAQCLSCAISCTMAARSPRTTATSLTQVSPPISPNPTRTAVKLQPRMSQATLPLSSSSSLIS